MDHQDHVALIRDGVGPPGSTWADLGSGGGAFTLALAEVLGPGGTIWSVDRDARALQEQALALRQRFPQVTLKQLVADFRQPLDLPPLDGIVMANSLHFVRNRAKDEVLRALYGYLRPGGRVVIVEYNRDWGNLWVPHPFSYDSWREMARRNGFAETRLLATRPSRHLREIYAAVSVRGVG